METIRPKSKPHARKLERRALHKRARREARAAIDNSLDDGPIDVPIRRVNLVTLIPVRVLAIVLVLLLVNVNAAMADTVVVTARRGNLPVYIALQEERGVPLTGALHCTAYTADMSRYIDIIAQRGDNGLALLTLRAPYNAFLHCTQYVHGDRIWYGPMELDMDRGTWDMPTIVELHRVPLRSFVYDCSYYDSGPTAPERVEVALYDTTFHSYRAITFATWDNALCGFVTMIPEGWTVVASWPSAVNVYVPTIGL